MFNIVFVLTVFTLGTIGGAINILLSQIAFVNNREFPGGPTAYGVAHYNAPQNIIGFACFIVAAWLQDGFLVSESVLCIAVVSDGALVISILDVLWF